MATSGAIQLSTAGITVWRVAEETAGVMPKTGFTKISEIKSIPDMSPNPDSLETTTLEETEYKTYIPGLKDLGGTLEFNANFTQLTFDEWQATCDQFDTNKKKGLSMWWCVRVPDLNVSCYFRGEPTRFGMPGAEVNAVLETPVRITPSNAPEWLPRLQLDEGGKTGTVPDSVESVMSLASVGGVAVKTSGKNSVTV